MRRLYNRLFVIVIFPFLLSFEGCGIYSEGDGKYCVTCWEEYDEERHLIYNIMPDKRCEYQLNDLQNVIDELVNKGYSCGKIKEP